MRALAQCIKSTTPAAPYKSKINKFTLRLEKSQFILFRALSASHTYKRKPL